MKVRRVDWHPADWLAGTHGLGWEATAVYITVINIIYDRTGPCPNDAAYIGSQIENGRSPNHRAGTTKRAQGGLARLIALGKLHVSPDGQWLTNGRCDVENGRAQERIIGSSRAGVASGIARKTSAHSARTWRALGAHSAPSNSKPINGLGRTSVRNHQPPSMSTVSEISTDPARDPAPDRGAPGRARSEPELERRPPVAAPKTAARLAELAAERRRKLMGET